MSHILLGEASVRSWHVLNFPWPVLWKVSWSSQEVMLNHMRSYSHGSVSHWFTEAKTTLISLFIWFIVVRDKSPLPFPFITCWQFTSRFIRVLWMHKELKGWSLPLTANNERQQRIHYGFIWCVQCNKRKTARIFKSCSQ